MPEVQSGRPAAMEEPALLLCGCNPFVGPSDFAQVLRPPTTPYLSTSPPSTIGARPDALLAQFERGTLPYMSPELVSGAPCGKPSDVWAVGVILFELLALCRASPSFHTRPEAHSPICALAPSHTRPSTNSPLHASTSQVTRVGGLCTLRTSLEVQQARRPAGGRSIWKAEPRGSAGVDHGVTALLCSTVGHGDVLPPVQLARPRIERRAAPPGPSSTHDAGATAGQVTCT